MAVTEFVTLDGVMQGPGRPDEDRRGGFEHGGWAPPYNDEVMAEVNGAGMAQTDAMLFGRRTYEDFNTVWPQQPRPNPMAEFLENIPKYVASKTLTEPLPWANSILVSDDVASAVAQLKEEPGEDIVILGSGELVRSLLPHDLIDRFVLLVHPLVLGAGTRLFPDDGPPASFRLLDSAPTTTGVVINTYQRAAA